MYKCWISIAIVFYRKEIKTCIPMFIKSSWCPTEKFNISLESAFNFRLFLPTKKYPHHPINTKWVSSHLIQNRMNGMNIILAVSPFYSMAKFTLKFSVVIKDTLNDTVSICCVGSGRQILKVIHWEWALSLYLSSHKGKWYNLLGQGEFSQKNIVKNVQGIFQRTVSLVWMVSLKT